MADDESPADRLALALDLHDAGVLMMREKLRKAARSRRRVSGTSGSHGGT